MIETEKKLNMGWNFDNSYVFLPEMYFAKQNPTSVISPKLIAFNEKLAKILGLNIKAMQTDAGASMLAGNSIPEGAIPIAQAYAGHQFGYFTKLGDGRALLLGEQITPDGKRFDIQLKGSGRTPYSRGGDGKASLGPMLREYIMSEAMHNLGIPTTRGLAVVATGEKVMRETALSGAVLTRIAASHIRVGTFQYAVAYGSEEELRLLAEYTLQRHFQDIAANNDRFLGMLKEVIRRQAALVAKWQLVGFIHGVMNTDNMALSGESIDYGPCAFMDIYDPKTVFSSIDYHGRYAYKNQPRIAAWNLAKFSETLLPLIHENEDKSVEMVNEEIMDFDNIYHGFWIKGMRAKLGLFNDKAEDETLINELFHIMQKYKADYTNTFKALTINEFDEMELFNAEEFIEWKNKWEIRLNGQKESIEDSRQLMKANNPAIIPRNHRMEEALEAAVKHGDYDVMKRFLEVLSNPYAYSKEQEKYSTLPPPSIYPYRTFCGT